MNHKEMVRTKNKILCVALAASIILRCVVNAIVLDVQSIILPAVMGIVIVLIMMALTWLLKNPFIVEYGMVGVFSLLFIMCMVMFPCTTNFMMGFLCIFMIVIYEDIVPIVLQCLISCISMTIFYNMYKQQLEETWSSDALVMCIIYVISGMFVFSAMSYLSAKSFRRLAKINTESNQAKVKAEGLLGEIGKSVGVLGDTSHKIQESVSVTDEISRQISTAADDVAQRATEEVGAAHAIQGKVQSGVEQISNIAEASTRMTISSEATSTTVKQSAKHVSTLQNQMQTLNQRMDGITNSITELSEENEKIITILSTLDEITSQTNLLSLNASIEAARAGEQGKGFAVVATEIRSLSESSQQFTDRIHGILEGIQEKTEMVKAEILSGQKSLSECNGYMAEVEKSFRDISVNTNSVLGQSQMIENRSAQLGDLLNQTLSDATAISDSVASTSAAMEEISSSISELYGNIDSVVTGYNDINSITNSLMQVSQSEEEQ